MLVWFLVGCWSLRLSIYLFSNRYYGKSEDPRYKRLRERWKNNAQRNFCIFYQAQALIAVIMTVPVLLFCLDARSHLGALEIIGVVIALMAMLGEMLADYQLNQFKKSAESKGKTCRSGLWRYSRHPNYFFDWLWWSGLALMATQSPHGWVGWASPMLILWLIFKVTGIPASEAQSLLTRGEEYRQYQQQTSVFVPWFPKV
jgi:steroid 5-alpha reductase family enzyme